MAARFGSVSREATIDRSKTTDSRPQVKPQRDTLPIWCPDCRRATYQPLAKLRAKICVCSGCRKAIKLTPEFVAAMQAL